MPRNDKKEGDVDPRSVFDLSDELDNHSYALKALGALLSTSNLEDFTPSSYGEGLKDKAEGLRQGISQLVDLYLDRQKQIVSGYCDAYRSSNLAIVCRSEKTITMIKQGAFTSREVIQKYLRDEINRLEIVISRDCDLTPRAISLKEICLLTLLEYSDKKENHHTKTIAA